MLLPNIKIHFIKQKRKNTFTMGSILFFAVLNFTVRYLFCQSLNSSSSTSTAFSFLTNPADMYMYFDDIDYMLPQDLVSSIRDNKSWEGILTYCPAVRSCYSDNVFGNTNVYAQTDGAGWGCCVPCDCSEDCFAKGNCCHDKEEERFRRNDSVTFTSDGMTCVSVYQIGQYSLEIQDTFFRYHVMLQQKCLNAETEDTANSENVMRCHFPSGEYVDDVTPVTSATSLVSYRNKYCAACNNDSDNILTWQQHVLCEINNDMPYNLFKRDASKQEIYQAIRTTTDCAIQWVPNNANITVSGCLSATELHASCPYGTEAFLEILCTGLDAPFIPYYGAMSLYRNIFCAACNMYGQFKDYVNGSCPYLGTIGQPSTLVFSALLDLSQLKDGLQNDPETTVEDRCLDGLTYNEVMVCDLFFA